MVVIEGINGAGMTYQGSVSTAQTKAEAQPKIENAGNEIASKEIAKETMNLSAKEASNDGSSDANSNQAAQQQMDKNKQLRKAVEDINKSAAGSQSEAIFGIHEKTNRVTIKIVDKKTKEVIKEYPPEKTLDMIAKAWELAGLMVDEKR